MFILPLCHLLKLSGPTKIVDDIGYDDIGLLYHPLVAP